MPWRDTQAVFARAVRDPGAMVPPDVALSSSGGVAEKRFAVYRNNHAVGLVDALSARFGVTAALVGEEFFQAMARTFVHSSIPETSVLIRYGAAFPGFIVKFPPAAKLPFLPDVARLEWIIGEAYHAPDAVPADLSLVAALSEADVAAKPLVLHPSLRLLSAPWPVFSIWQAHQAADPKVALNAVTWEPECGLVIRPALDVDVVRLAPAAYRFVSALADGVALGPAAEHCGITDQAEFAGLLQFVFSKGAIVGV